MAWHRSNRRMRVHDNEHAADRRRYPANDFVLGALVLALLIVIIGVGFATGIVR